MFSQHYNVRKATVQEDFPPHSCTSVTLSSIRPLHVNEKLKGSIPFPEYKNPKTFNNNNWAVFEIRTHTSRNKHVKEQIIVLYDNIKITSNQDKQYDAQGHSKLSVITSFSSK